MKSSTGILRDREPDLGAWCAMLPQGQTGHSGLEVHPYKVGVRFPNFVHKFLIAIRVISDIVRLRREQSVVICVDGRQSDLCRLFSQAAATEPSIPESEKSVIRSGLLKALNDEAPNTLVKNCFHAPIGLDIGDPERSVQVNRSGSESDTESAIARNEELRREEFQKPRNRRTGLFIQDWTLSRRTAKVFDFFACAIVIVAILSLSASDFLPSTWSIAIVLVAAATLGVFGIIIFRIRSRLPIALAAIGVVIAIEVVTVLAVTNADIPPFRMRVFPFALLEIASLFAVCAIGIVLAQFIQQREHQ